MAFDRVNSQRFICQIQKKLESRNYLRIGGIEISAPYLINVKQQTSPNRLPNYNYDRCLQGSEVFISGIGETNLLQQRQMKVRLIQILLTR